MEDTTMTDAGERKALPRAMPPTPYTSTSRLIRRVPLDPLSTSNSDFRVKRRGPPPRPRVSRYHPLFRIVQTARIRSAAERAAQEERFARIKKRCAEGPPDFANKRVRTAYEHGASFDRQTANVDLPGAFPQVEPSSELAVSPPAPWRRIRVPVSRIAQLARNAQRGIQQSIQIGFEFASTFAHRFTRSEELGTRPDETQAQAQAMTENEESAAASQLCAELAEHASHQPLPLTPQADPVAAQLQAELSDHISHLFPHDAAQSHNDLEVPANSISEVYNMSNETAQGGRIASVADDDAEVASDLNAEVSPNADDVQQEQALRPAITNFEARRNTTRPARAQNARPRFSRPMFSHRLNDDWEPPQVIHGRRRIHFIPAGVELTEAERNRLLNDEDLGEREHAPVSPAPTPAATPTSPPAQHDEEREAEDPEEPEETEEEEGDKAIAETEERESQALQPETAPAEEGGLQQYALIPPLLPWLRRPILPPPVTLAPVPSVPPTSEEDIEEEIEETRDLLSATTVSPAQRPDRGVNPTSIQWWESDTPMGRPVSAVRLFHPHSPPVNIGNRTAPLQQEEYEDIQRDTRRRLARERRRALKRNRVPRGEAAVRPLSEEREEQVETAMSGPGNRILASTLEGAELTRQKLLTCYEDLAWLNDEVINGHMALTVDYLRSKAGNQGRNVPPKYYAFNSFFYTKLREGGYQAVSRWARRAKIHGEALLNVETLFIPVHQNSHWTLLVVSPVNRTIEYFDSLGSRSPVFVNNIKEWLRAELGDLYDEDEWSVLHTQSPQQNNGSDCGVFLLTTAKAIALGLDPVVYGPRDIPLLRKKIVAELLCGGYEGDLDPAGESGENRL